MSEWYDLSAFQEVTRIIGKKWVKYTDDGDDDDENDFDAEENRAIEKLQSLRHVSIIVPQVLEDLQQMCEEFKKKDPFKTDASEVKKLIQQTLKICKVLNFFLYNHVNLIMAKETSTLTGLVEALQLIRKFIGNETILNVVTHNLLISILMCIRFSDSVEDLLAIKGFVSLLMMITKKSLNFENKGLILVCIQIFELIL